MQHFGYFIWLFMIQFIVLLLGCAHGFYLSFALLTKNNKENNANLLLALLVFSFALRLFFIFLDVSGFIDNSPHLIELDAPIAFLFGPLLFLYVQKMTSPSFYRVNFLHFLPFILAIVISLPFYWQSAEFKLDWLLEEPTTQLGLWYLNLFDIIFISMKLVLTTLYFIKIYQRLLQHRTNITNNFSNVEKISLTWLIRLFSLMSFLFFGWILKEAFGFNSDVCTEYSIGIYCEIFLMAAEGSSLLVECGLVLCIYLISIYGLKQPAIFTVNTNLVKQKRQRSDTKKSVDVTEAQSVKDEKYQKSSLTEELSAKVFEEISRFVHQQNMFLEPELSLTELAEKSGFSKHHLSQAINQSANKSFFDFINCLRVEHAKSLLHSKNKMNVLDIALASGFNSRSSFYCAFKKQTQLTPNEYKKQGTLKTCTT
jgi:AraC-like DNA-binding protein